jgi:hypothetical protein
MDEDLAHNYKVTYSCGHTITYPMYPRLIWKDGALAMCYECGDIRRVAKIEDLGLAYTPPDKA